jgi:hypothetical protein
LGVWGVTEAIFEAVAGRPICRRPKVQKVGKRL